MTTILSPRDDLTGAAATRRSVLRTGAWTVPVLAVASVAPAFAASTSGSIVSATSAYNPKNNKQFDVSVTLSPGGDQVTALELRFRVSTANWTEVGVPPAGWVSTLSPAQITYSLTGLPLPGNSPTISASFSPIRGSNTTATTLTVELWVNNALCDTRTFTT